MNNTDSEQGEALEPCPFCGVVPKMQTHTQEDEMDEGRYLFFVECANNACPMALVSTGGPLPSERLAARVWNTRRASVAAVEGDANTGLHCNGCGILIMGWPNVYRCVTSGCGRIYHYQCLLEHCASDHLCQNCKQSYKPYVLHCNQCGAEAFDCCLSKPCVKCGDAFTAARIVTATLSTLDELQKDNDRLVCERDIAREREQEALRELPDAITKVSALRDWWRKRKHETSGNTSDNYATMFFAANQILAALGAAVCAGCGAAITSGQEVCGEVCRQAVEELGER